MCPAAVTTDPKLTPARREGGCDRARVSISSRCGAQQNECPKNGVGDDGVPQFARQCRQTGKGDSVMRVLLRSDAAQ